MGRSSSSKIALQAPSSGQSTTNRKRKKRSKRFKVDKNTKIKNYEEWQLNYEVDCTVNRGVPMELNHVHPLKFEWQSDDQEELLEDSDEEEEEEEEEGEEGEEGEGKHHTGVEVFVV